MYIGQTIKSLEKRKYGHVFRSLNNEDNNYFHSALRKYEIENFSWEVLEECSNAEFLNALEVFYIGYYDTFNNGYNLTLGGEGTGGHKCSDETRKKMSIARTGEKHPWFGRKHTKESKLKMSKSRTGNKNHFYGKHHSIETKRKMSEANSGEKHHMYGKELSAETKRKLSIANSGENSPSFGIHLSDEVKKKISMARMGKYTGKNSANAVAVIIDNKYFDTRNEAAKFVGISPAGVRKRIIHKTKWLDYSYA